MQTHHSAAEWSKLIETWLRSGESRAQFAARHGLAPRTLTWWRWKLSRQKLQAPQSGRRRRRRRVPAPRLIAVEVQQGAHAASDDAEVAWELDSSTGMTLRVRKGISGSDLASIMAAMMGMARP